MTELFIENPVIPLFIVAAIGYWVGSIRIRGSNMGVAAVLFVGLGFGALYPAVYIPDILVFLGLTMFVYTIGLSSGPTFFASFRQRGFRDILFVFFMLTFSASITVGIHFLLGFKATTTAGLFAGVSTNTPALAGLLDVINTNGFSPEMIKTMSEEAVVGYSLSYPMGVIGVMIAIHITQKMLRVDYQKEVRDNRKEYPLHQNVSSCTVQIRNEAHTGISLRDLLLKMDWDIVFGRMQRGDKTFLPNWDTELQLGDKITVVGDEEDLDMIIAELGEALTQRLSFENTEYDTSQFFVSNPKVAGEQLATLNLSEKYAAIVTRIRRGDIDLLANNEANLELGDRVRVVARRRDISSLSRLFGNSYEALSHIDLLSFGMGMALGLLLGTITFELPGGVSFKLGFAGGPLIIALILGNLRRTGPIVWTMPYSANLTLRQIGLILLLAGVGVNSGHNFAQTIHQGGGGWIFLASTFIGIVSAILTLVIGYKVLKIPFSILSGMVATQPAILDFALERSGNKFPNLGFTLMLPIALITKIVYVQFLFALLR